MLTHPPTTASPGPTSTGTDSPVIIAVSTALWPLTTTPSVAIFIPGRTTNRSPTRSAEMSMLASVPSRSTSTSLGACASRARTAAPDRRFARASR